MTGGDVRLSNEAWESLYRAQATIMRALSEGPFRAETLQINEYGVLYALSASADGLRMTDLGKDVLLTQAGMSRLVLRLERRGLLERTDDPDDGRACRLRLTSAGLEVQRRVGSAHARQITDVMGRTLDHTQLSALRDLCRELVAGDPDEQADPGAGGTEAP